MNCFYVITSCLEEDTLWKKELISEEKGTLEKLDSKEGVNRKKPETESFSFQNKRPMMTISSHFSGDSHTNNR